MGHCYREIDKREIDKSFTRETKPMIETPNTPVPIAMNNQDNEKNIGYTQVWEGRANQFIGVIKIWSHIPEDYLKINSAPNPSNIILLVANEHIDWAYLRACEDYRPIRQSNSWMRDGIGAERTEYKSKLEKEAEERRNP